MVLLKEMKAGVVDGWCLQTFSLTGLLTTMKNNLNTQQPHIHFTVSTRSYTNLPRTPPQNKTPRRHE